MKLWHRLKTRMAMILSLALMFTLTGCPGDEVCHTATASVCFKFKFENCQSTPYGSCSGDGQWMKYKITDKYGVGGGSMNHDYFVANPLFCRSGLEGNTSITYEFEIKCWSRGLDGSRCCERKFYGKATVNIPCDKSITQEVVMLCAE